MFQEKFLLADNLISQRDLVPDRWAPETECRVQGRDQGGLGLIY